MVWIVLALSMLFDYMLMQNESWMCSLTLKKCFGVIVEKRVDYRNSPIDYKWSFCPFMQLNKIMDVFWVGLRKRCIWLLSEI